VTVVATTRTSPEQGDREKSDARTHLDQAGHRGHSNLFLPSRGDLDGTRDGGCGQAGGSEGSEGPGTGRMGRQNSRSTKLNGKRESIGVFSLVTLRPVPRLISRSHASSDSVSIQFIYSYSSHYYPHFQFKSLLFLLPSHELGWLDVPIFLGVRQNRTIRAEFSHLHRQYVSTFTCNLHTERQNPPWHS
jgi:hypothetical protein